MRHSIRSLFVYFVPFVVKNLPPPFHISNYTFFPMKQPFSTFKDQLRIAPH